MTNEELVEAVSAVIRSTISTWPMQASVHDVETAAREAVKVTGAAIWKHQLGGKTDFRSLTQGKDT